MHVHHDTPARRSLTECLRKVKRPQGRPTHTWIEQIKQDLNTINIRLDLNKPTETITILCDLAQNRNTWHDIVKHVMLH